MRILRIANVPDNRSGGMSRTMHATADELRRMGHEVDQIFSAAFHSFGPKQIHRYSDSLEAARLIRERLASGYRYDLVELHEPLSLVYARWRRRDAALPPAVVFSYGLEERGWRAMLEYCRSKRVRLPLKSKLTSWLLAQQAAAGVRRVDHVICSNVTDLQYLAHAGVSQERLTEHHSGVEMEFLAAEASNGPRNLDLDRVLFMGNWIERKGVLDLVPAFVELSHHEARVTLTLAGVSVEPDVVLAAFPAALHARVRVIRRVEGNEALIHLYREHAIFVLPSYFEGQPLSLIEAAACRLAPVVTDIGGNRDFVTNEVHGLLIPVGNPKLLTTALLRLLRDPVLAQRLRTNARQRAATHTWLSTSRRLADAYTKVVARNSRTTPRC